MRSTRQFTGDRSGASAIEFALVAPLLIFAILFSMIAGLIVYENQALDYATMKAARQIMTGQVQTAGIGQAAFRTQVLCPYLPATMSCSNVIISVQTITEASQPNGYYTLVNGSATALLMPALAVDTAPYSIGVSGNYEYLIVVYPMTFLPGFLSKLFGTATYNGAPAYTLVSTATFKNERYGQ